MDFPPSPFWTFSLAVYRKPGVAEACLALQDRHGLDVNLLLAALFTGAAGRALDADAWALLEGTVGAYHREVVRPLRAARRALKPLEGAQPAGRPPVGGPPVGGPPVGGPPVGGPPVGGPTVAGQLRSAVKAAELDAEHLEQLMIEQALAGLPAGNPPAASGTASGADRARANALAYLAAARVAPDSADRAALERLVAAIPSSS